MREKWTRAAALALTAALALLYAFPISGAREPSERADDALWLIVRVESEAAWALPFLSRQAALFSRENKGARVIVRAAVREEWLHADAALADVWVVSPDAWNARLAAGEEAASAAANSSAAGTAASKTPHPRLRPAPDAVRAATEAALHHLSGMTGGTASAPPHAAATTPSDLPVPLCLSPLVLAYEPAAQSGSAADNADNAPQIHEPSPYGLLPPLQAPRESAATTPNTPTANPAAPASKTANTPAAPLPFLVPRSCDRHLASLRATRAQSLPADSIRACETFADAEAALRARRAAAAILPLKSALRASAARAAQSLPPLHIAPTGCAETPLAALACVTDPAFAPDARKSRATARAALADAFLARLVSPAAQETLRGDDLLSARADLRLYAADGGTLAAVEDAFWQPWGNASSAP